MSETQIHARGLSRSYPAPRRGFGRPERTIGLDDVDLTVRAGSAVGVIGESGSGKSTLVRLLLGLDVPTAGTVEVDGRAVDARGSARSLHWLRRATGIVFQDPYASLDPRMSIGRIVGEPLWALGIEGDRRARVRERTGAQRFQRNNLFERFGPDGSRGVVLSCFRFGAWLSLVERSVRDREVAGSNPVAPTTFITHRRPTSANGGLG